MVNLRVPASSANLGPGFDCLSVALSLYADIRFDEREEGFSITGCPLGMEKEDNLIYQSYLYAVKIFGVAAHGLRIHVQSDIPVARGLGSSAACVLAGIKGAAMLHQVKLSEEDLLRLACDIEGHPDNAAAALHGGFRLSVVEEGSIIIETIAANSALRLMALIPDFSLSTRQARNVLKDIVPLKDAVFNLSRTVLLVKALERGDMDLLLFSCQDRLHQPYRFPLIPDGASLAGKMEEIGIACCISGAGPSLLCMYFDDSRKLEIKSVCESFAHWHARELNIDTHGLSIL